MGKLSRTNKFPSENFPIELWNFRSIEKRRAQRSFNVLLRGKVSLLKRQKFVSFRISKRVDWIIISTWNSRKSGIPTINLEGFHMWQKVETRESKLLLTFSHTTWLNGKIFSVNVCCVDRNSLSSEKQPPLLLIKNETCKRRRIGIFAFTFD